MFRWRFLFAIAAAAITFASTAHAQDVRDTLLAPLPIRDQFLLNNGFFFFEPEEAGVLDRDEWRVSLTAADANTFAKSAWVSRSLEGRTTRAAAIQELSSPRYEVQDSVFLVDGETHRMEFSMHRGVGDHLEIGVTVPLTTIGGGWSDSLIEAFHRSMGLGNAERESLQRNSETVYLRTATTNYVRQRSGGFAPGDIALTAKYELLPLEEKRLALSVAGGIELPTGHSRTLDGSGSLDGGIELMATRDFPAFHVHASVGMLRLGRDRPLGTRSQFLISDTVSISHLISDRTASILQLTVSESPFRSLGIPEFTRRSSQLSIGVSHQIGRSLVLYTAFIENLLSYDNGADAGFAWGVKVRM